MALGPDAIPLSPRSNVGQEDDLPPRTEDDAARNKTREDLVTATWLDEHGPYLILEMDSVEDEPPSDRAAFRAAARHIGVSDN